MSPRITPVHTRIDCRRFERLPEQLHAWLLHEQFVEAKARYTHAEFGWIEHNNTEILDNAKMMGPIPKRRWQIFQRSLP